MNRFIRWIALVALAGVACGGLAGIACRGEGAGADDQVVPAETTPAFRGRVLAEPIPRPAFTLLATDGEPYDFGERTAGKVTLLFFGYTHCPDVCPIHMGNIAAVLNDLGVDARRSVEVVFVTTDPERDSAQRIRGWLDRFDPRFVGLRGNPEEIEAIQRRLGLPPSVVEAAPAGGDYTVGHAAQVLAFSADGPARVVYPFGTRQADWTHDLRLLLRDVRPIRSG